ncbi:MAG: NADH-quinone oxidoreductase subunit L [Anaerolineae bacterium]|nr:NADH-quinone oxidoreductase subunit L [Anaerolineae bacterium]MDW8100647.1 NADH-quinone oxidoreductase subunit L [Anaerolineae bacterium]
MIAYAWLLLAFPALGMILNLALGRRWGKNVTGVVASGAVLLSFLVAMALFVALNGLPAEERSLEQVLWRWIAIEQFQVDIGLLIDPLSVFMALVVTGVGFLIHVYSIGYMWKDERYVRYFVYLNLFVLMMLTLVMANNFVQMFIGWEGVGLASYLLIGFWFFKPSAADAGKKAFLVNRIGDVGFILATLLVFVLSGQVNFRRLFQPEHLQVLQGSATAIGLLLLLAATGKSAQIPLYVWLPDAMEGPTPVSALIHAATMVTAGVYMVARMSPIYSLTPTAMSWVATIGVLTALLAATIALAQTDIKRILAYSTISQLGYMFLGVGVGAFTAGLFHLYTHAFFKALLFLGAGSVMHALRGELDIRKMGGLRDKLPTTYRAFVVGAAALAGFPLLSGFFSKDEILLGAWERSPILWLIGIATAFLTATYAFRVVFIAFWGRPRDRKLYEGAHEAPRVMTIPLMILAVGAAIGGVVGLPGLSWLHEWLSPVFEGVAHEAKPGVIAWVLMLISAAVALGGIYFAYRAFVTNPGLAAELRRRLGVLDIVVQRQYYVDELYMAAVVNPIKAMGDWLAVAFDQRGIDGVVNGIASAAGWIGERVRRVQTGLVGTYALTLLLGVVLVMAYFVWIAR